MKENRSRFAPREKACLSRWWPLKVTLSIFEASLLIFSSEKNSCPVFTRISGREQISLPSSTSPNLLTNSYVGQCFCSIAHTSWVYLLPPKQAEVKANTDSRGPSRTVWKLSVNAAPWAPHRSPGWSCGCSFVLKTYKNKISCFTI